MLRASKKSFIVLFFVAHEAGYDFEFSLANASQINRNAPKARYECAPHYSKMPLNVLFFLFFWFFVLLLSSVFAFLCFSASMLFCFSASLASLASLLFCFSDCLLRFSHLFLLLCFSLLFRFSASLAFLFFSASLIVCFAFLFLSFRLLIFPALIACSCCLLSSALAFLLLFSFCASLLLRCSALTLWFCIITIAITVTIIIAITMTIIKTIQISSPPRKEIPCEIAFEALFEGGPLVANGGGGCSPPPTPPLS